MSIHKDNNPKSLQSSGKEIDFPTTYDLKVIVELNKETGVSQKEIERILNRLKIPFRFSDIKLSSKQTYVSHNIQVTLMDKAQMDELYKSLNQVPEVKFVL